MRLLGSDANKDVHHYNRHTTPNARTPQGFRLATRTQTMCTVSKEMQTVERIKPGSSFLSRTSFILSTLETCEPVLATMFYFLNSQDLKTEQKQENTN